MTVSCNENQDLERATGANRYLFNLAQTSSNSNADLELGALDETAQQSTCTADPKDSIVRRYAVKMSWNRCAKGS